MELDGTQLFFIYKFSKLNADIKSIVLFGAPWCPHTEFLVQSCAIWVVWEHFQRYLCYQICKPHQNGHNSFSFHPRSPRFHMEVDLYLISWPCLEKFMIFFLNPICPLLFIIFVSPTKTVITPSFLILESPDFAWK